MLGGCRSDCVEQARDQEGLTVAVLTMASLVLSIDPASAITFGQPDGTRHPNVGALLADYDPGSPARISSAQAP
jgi:hypothetical protein